MSNSLVPTGAGTLRPTYLLPVTMRAGAGITAAETLIVGFRGFKDFQGDTVSLHLKCRGVNISLPRYGLEGLTALALARLMDEAQFRNGLGEVIRGQKAGEKRIGLPAILGLREPAAVLEDLEGVIGARVFEIPMLPPSIPGLRIFNRFREHLIAKGATFLLGNLVTGADCKKRPVRGDQGLNPPLDDRIPGGELRPGHRAFPRRRSLGGYGQDHRTPLSPPRLPAGRARRLVPGAVLPVRGAPDPLGGDRHRPGPPAGG